MRASFDHSASVKYNPVMMVKPSSGHDALPGHTVPVPWSPSPPKTYTQFH